MAEALFQLIAIAFLWIVYIPKVLFALPEVTFKKRFYKVLGLLFAGGIFFAGLNSIAYFVPRFPPLAKIPLFIFSIYFSFSLVGIFAKRYFYKNSISEKWKPACIISQFLIIDTETGKPTLIPRIHAKLPGRLIIDTPGWTTSQIEAISGELESALKMPIGGIEPWIVQGEVKKGYNVIWYNAQDIPGMVPFRTEIYRDLPKAGYVKLGLSMKGWIQLHLTDISHFLVFAMTGYGKSVQLQNILTQYYLTIPTSAFLLIDFKSGETFQQFRGITNVAVVTNCNAVNDNDPYRKAISALQMVVHIMKIRQSMIATNGKKNYYAYGLFPIIVMIEEMREFLKGFDSDVKIKGKKFPSYAKQAANLIDTLTAKGRSAGIHVFIGTQRFDTSSGPATIRENLPIKIGGKTGSKDGSKMIVNTEYLYRMEAVKGRMAFVDMDGGGGFIKMQVPFLDEGEAVGFMTKHEHDTPQETYEKLLWAIENPYWWMGKENKAIKEIVISQP